MKIQRMLVVVLFPLGILGIRFEGAGKDRESPQPKEPKKESKLSIEQEVMQIWSKYIEM